MHMVLPTDPGAGSFTITGQPGAKVSVSFPEKVELHNGEGHTIIFLPAIPIWNSANSQNTGEQIFPVVTGGTVTFSPDGKLYLWFGGSLTTEGAIETMSGIGYNVKCYASPRAIAICRFFPFDGNGSVKHNPRRDIVVSSKNCAQKSRSGKVVGRARVLTGVHP